jgi:hypothetical protein
MLIRHVLDVLSYQEKISDHQVGHPLLFCFALVHVKGRGGWRSRSKWREEVVGDHDDFVVQQQRERVTREGSLIYVST